MTKHLVRRINAQKMLLKKAIENEDARKEKRIRNAIRSLEERVAVVLADNKKIEIERLAAKKFFDENQNVPRVIEAGLVRLPSLKEEIDFPEDMYFLAASFVIQVWHDGQTYTHEFFRAHYSKEQSIKEATEFAESLGKVDPTMDAKWVRELTYEERCEDRYYSQWND